MRYSVIIRPEAERDVQEALAWYDEQRQGLGEALLAEVEDALHRVSENPHLAAIVHREIRRVLTKRFPCGVFFIVEDESIIVLAVQHAKRDPARWQRRR